MGRFDRTAAQASPATVAASSDRSTLRDRRVAAAAADALKDALSHATLTNAYGVGLRGGSYATDFGNSAVVLHLHGTRFTTDVAVSGRLTMPYRSTLITARLTVSQTGGDAGVLRVTGREMTAGRLQITGRLDGRNVALSVPVT